MVHQHPLTLLTPVRPEKLSQLNDILEKIKKELQAGRQTDFSKLTTVHYARWIILSEESFRDPPAFPVPVRLIFSANYDGSEEDHFDELSTVFAEYIDAVYECCENFPSIEERTAETRKNYLKQWRVGTAAFFIGAPGRTVLQVKQESELKEYIWSYIQKNKWDGKPATAIHQSIKKEIETRKEFDWAKEKAAVKKVNWPFLIAYGLLVIAVLPFMILWILYIFLFHELRDKNGTLTLSRIPDGKVKRLEEDEDLFPQNQFTQVAVMKPGIVRYLNFQLWMLRTRVLAGHMFVHGKLLNIPTIHFARWLLIDNNKHVIFFSNFDGSWQQYLGDFIDQSGWGLSGIFSNTVNFPKTRFMVTGGAYDEEHFLAWSRSTQIPTQVWYCAYPQLSIKNVNNNTKIRNELFADLNEEQARLFLKRF